MSLELEMVVRILVAAGLGAAIGLAAGAGLFLVAVVTTGVTLLVYSFPATFADLTTACISISRNKGGFIDFNGEDTGSSHREGDSKPG